MERDRGFNFKLLVPLRANSGQVSAVRPQEIGYNKCFDKEQSMPFSNTSMVVPTKPTRQDVPKMKVLPSIDTENNCNPEQLYSKLFDEVEKIKCWKVKVESETVQKERKLQENKRTIETQRKAIQELQFGNESLSIKLEEQISENEDLRNKNNATQNLCTLLKDTFQRSAEKMHLFESEREETHHLFMENSESIQKIIAAFKSLHIRVEADQHEMQKVKEGLLQFEDLKEKFDQEYNMKQKEVVVLQTKLKDKENELQKVLLNLHETQGSCKQLQETANQQYELLKSSKNEQDCLLQKLQTAEQLCKETETSREAIATALEQSKEEYAQIILKKDSSLQELNKVKDQQADELEQIQTTIHELQNSLTFEIQRAKELEVKLMAINKELERKTTLLGETMEQSAKKDGQIKILEDELDIKSKSIESLLGKIEIIEVRVEELTAELSRKTEQARLFKNKVDIASAEKNILEKACEAAEKAQKDLKEKANTYEVWFDIFFLLYLQSLTHCRICYWEIIFIIKVQEMEGQLIIEMKKNEAYTFQMEQLKKDIMQHEVKYEELLSSFNELQSEKKTIQEQIESGSSEAKALEKNLKASEEKGMKITKELQRLEEENRCLREEVDSLNTKIHDKYEETENLQKNIEERCEHLQEEITKKVKQIKELEAKLCNLKTKFESKAKAQEECQKENKTLKKQIAKETAKSSQLENVINNLKEESQNCKRLSEEEHQKLLEDLGSKSTFAAELQDEAQKLRCAAAEANMNKEDAELKCQHKIADMVALMEKHKSQYDRIVEEKDAELKRKEMDAVASRTSLELELLQSKTENDCLKKQLKKEMTEKGNLQKEMNELKKDISSMKISQQSEAKNKQSAESNSNEARCTETPKETSVKRHVLDFKTRKTPNYSKDHESTANTKMNEIQKDLKTPSRSTTNRVGATPKIKSYRIRTPPSAEKSAPWRKGIMELDPKSDSSEQNDLLIQSPVIHKSPGNSLKLAAIKRMRDAGWTAVTGSDKKKKKTNEKIFA
ncbi:synaptonemal complex protein 1 [Centroberyx affinis]|uniref:synaptonemal complex protein 1 n=1 Tax=Centroberyx affinis TaxID=166261 RepID=UPI003A5C1F01